MTPDPVHKNWVIIMLCWSAIEIVAWSDIYLYEIDKVTKKVFYRKISIPLSVIVEEHLQSYFDMFTRPFRGLNVPQKKKADTPPL